jgi:formiminotetrahydrofolate cyclodeaminase
MLADKTIREFSDEVASSSPAPGGGSVSALCGNLSAALVSMVSNLTIGKEKYAAVEGEMRGVVSESEGLRSQLLGLVDEDTEAFNAVMAAFKLPKDSTERKAALEAAFKQAAGVPLRTARLCLRCMALSEAVLEKGNRNSVTDAAVAGLVAYAGLQGALLNVRINLGSIKDGEYVNSAKAEAEKLSRDANSLMGRLTNSANSRV